jgi:hypothetical protein
MNKVKKILKRIVNHSRWWCIFLIFICAQKSFSQNIISVIQQQIESYSNNNYQEKIFLHTDKTVYTTGEILWFKAYVTDAATNQFSSLSKIAYVEIINKDNKPLMQAKVDIDSGRGIGSLKIPSSIRTGNYLIRAYTNWMKNFDPNFYFRQSVSIINPDKKPLEEKADTDAHFHIQFFPEGGNLVYGFDNTVAFKITDAYGKGLGGSGFILDDKNDTFAIFETAHLGMGTFSFRPLKGNIYHAVVKINNENIFKNLPAIFEKGWTMHLTQEGNKLSIHVGCNVSNENNVFLFAQTKNTIKFARMQTLNNGNTTFTINQSELGEGISQLTIFNQEKQPVCERLFFKRPAHLLPIDLENIQSDYSERSKVDLNVVVTDSGESNLSLSVYLADSLQPLQNINLVNYLWLSSDLKGPVESPEFYLENPDSLVEKATDNLMLTQGWRRFKWEEVLKNIKPSFTFLPEYEGAVISGKLSPKIAGLPVNGIPVSLAVPGKYFKFSNTISSPAGLFHFNVDKFFGNSELIVQANKEDSNYNLIIDNPFSETFIENFIKPIHLNASLSNEITLRSIGAQAQDIYEPENTQNFRLPPSFDTTSFFGVPERQYYLDAYTRFPTMEEVLNEYVKEVHLRKTDKNFYCRVFNEPRITYFDDDPLVLVDGVPVSDFNKIINIDPLKIKKIDIITTIFFQGTKQYDGIVSYATYNGDLDGYQLDPNSLVVEYDGLQLAREFYSPQYTTVKEKQSSLPDYRNVLYWLPSLRASSGKKNISFYTSDIPGKYIVVAQGISDSGRIGFVTESFNVSSKADKN